MRKIYVLLICLITISCSKEEFDIENLNGNEIISMGHGGMGVGNTYPIDSYESILKALNLGMDGSEMDVQMTRDSVLVAFHDQDLSDITNLSGLINSKGWSEIQDAYYTQTPYLNYSLISLDQLFSHIKNVKKYKFTFDCRLFANSDDTDKYYSTYINAIDKIVQKYDLENNLYIESQNVNFLNRFKNLDTNYKLFLYSSSFESGFDIALSNNLWGISMSTRNISKEQIEIAHANNLYVAIWNIHTKSDNVDAINKNPDFIQTDDVKSLVKLLDL